MVKVLPVLKPLVRCCYTQHGLKLRKWQGLKVESEQGIQRGFVGGHGLGEAGVNSSAEIIKVGIVFGIQDFLLDKFLIALDKIEVGRVGGQE